MPQLASQAVNYRRSATAEAQSSGNVKGKKAKAAAEARDRDIQTTKSWRPEGRMVGHMGEHKGAVNKIVVSPDQRFFASASDDGSVRIWECGRLEGRGVTNESRQQFTKQGGKIKHIAIGEGGQVSSESIPLVFGCCR
jgi:phosphoinositide-3-kinase regulatory subunit 4